MKNDIYPHDAVPSNVEELISVREACYGLARILLISVREHLLNFVV